MDRDTVKIRIYVSLPIMELFLNRLTVTAEQISVIKKTPQRTPEWKSFRKHRLTASNFGTAVGHNPFKTPEDLVQDMLFGLFKGNAATQWGTDHEEIARNQYEARNQELSVRKYRNTPRSAFRVKESGLVVVPDRPYFACSPDGIVDCLTELDPGTGEVILDRGLLEIKCPAKKKFYDTIPHMYWDQIQGIMGFLGLAWCDFVVWIPSGMTQTRFNFDEIYFKDFLLPKLTEFYMTMYVPEALAVENVQSIPRNPDSPEDTTVRSTVPQFILS